MKKNLFKKSLSLFLSILMVFTMIPATSLTSLAFDQPVFPSIENEDVLSETADGVTVKQYAEWINDNETKAKATITVEMNPVYENTYHDIVYVVDVSSSINAERLQFEKDALKTTIEEIEVANEYVKNKTGIEDENRVALITFSTDAKVESNFVSDYNVFETAVDNLSTGGSTNYGSAMEKAQELINNRTDKSRKAAIVFVTDGAASHNFTQAQNIITKLDTEGVYTYCVQYMFNYDYDNVFKKILNTSETNMLGNSMLSATREILCNTNVEEFKFINGFSELHFENIEFVSATNGTVVVENNDFILTVSEMTCGEIIELTFLLDATKSTDTLIPLCPYGSYVAYKNDNGTNEIYFYDTFMLRQNHFTVTYDLSWGKGTTPVDSKIYNKNTSVIVAPADGFKMDYYEFGGWDVSYSYEVAENGAVVTKYSDDLQVVQPGESFKIKGNTVLKAIWTRTEVYKEAVVKDPVYPIMKAYTSNSTEDYHAYKENVVTITFLDEIDDEAIKDPNIPSWDVSEANDKSVMAWMKENKAETQIATTTAGLTEATTTTTRYDVFIGGKDGINANKNSNCLFYNFSVLKEINELENLHMNNATDISHMFRNCTSLTSLNLSKWNTENLTYMNSVFNNCNKLISIKFGDKWNTKNVTDMGYLFYRCPNLTSLDLSSFNTLKVKDMRSMFSGCSNIESLNIDSFNVSSVINMSSMFNGCSKLTKLNLTNWKTESVTDVNQMFSGCSNLTLLDVSNFNTDKVTNMYAMFKGCSKLTELNISNFNTTNVKDMSSLFTDCSSLTSLSFSEKWNTSNTTNMNAMFYNCSKLTELDINNFDTLNVTDTSYMFRDCSSLISIKFGDKWNTKNITNINYMFFNCSSLASLNIRDWNTSNITKMDSTFGNCLSLTSLDLSGWNTSNTTNMKAMFYGCSSLISLNLNNFNVAKVTDMYRMFNNCLSLTSLNLNWSGALNSTCNTKEIFDVSSKLEKINLSNWTFSDTINITIASPMLTDIYLYDISENDAAYSNKLISNTTAAANIKIHTNIEPTIFETMTTRTSWLNNVSNDNIIYDEPVEVLGISTSAEEVQEKDYIIYPLTIYFDGQSGVYSDEITVSDTLPEGLTFVENYFTEEHFNEFAIPYNPNDTTFMISPNYSIDPENPQLTKDVADIIVVYPTYDAETNTVSFTVNEVPGGTYISVLFACQVDKLADNENGKYFYNTAKYTDKDGNTKNTLTTIHYVKPTDDTDTCRVYYYNNGDVPDGIPKVDYIESYRGSVVKVLYPPVVKGYTFSSWTAEDCNGNPIDISSGYFTLNDKTYLEGTWTKDPEPEKYTVTYEYTGNTPTGAPTLWAQSYEVGEIVSVSDIPIISDYDFIGWTSDDVEISDDGTFVMPEKDVTFTGYYKPAKYTITYMLDGVEYKTEKATATSVITLEEPTVSDDYTFLDWSSDDVSIINGTSFIMPSNNVTLYGYTEASNKIYNVTYKWNDNSYIPTDITLTNFEGIVGNEYILPVIENTNEYTFKGWTVVNDEGNEITITNNTITMPESDITIIGNCIRNYTLTGNNLELKIGEVKNVNVSVNPTPTNNKITYTSADPSIATIDNEGNVKGVKEGNTTIIATLEETDATVEMTVKVSNYILTIIGNKEMYVTKEQTLVATPNPELADGLNNTIEWKSSDRNIATVDDNGKIVAIKEGTVTITATLKATNSSAEFNVDVIDYKLTADNIVLEIGESKPIEVTFDVEPTDKLITWEVTDPTVISIDKDGNVIGLKEGETTIKGTLNETGAEITITIKVNLPNYIIDITGKNEVYIGDKETLKYEITPAFADTVNKNIIWTSSDETVATVDNNGNITALKDGEVIITATLEVNDAYDVYKITVLPYDVIVKNENINLYIGKSENIDYTITPDTDKKIIWSSDDESVAVVDENGKVTATGEGTTTITGTIPNTGITITVIVTVKDYTLTINGENTMFVSKEQTLVTTLNPELANGLNGTIEWESSDKNIATVDANSKVVALKEGTVTITATLKATGASDAFEITIIDYTLTANDVELNVGETKKVEITITPKPTDNTIIWESKDPTIATVDEEGNVTGINPGTTTIIGTLEETGTKIEITVIITTPNYVIDITGADTTYIGKFEQLTSTITPKLHSTVDNTIIWTSSDKTVATVDNNGNVKALKKGTVTITAKLKVNGASDTHTITVLDYTLVGNGPFDMIMGETNKAKVTITPNPTNNTVMWTSSDSNIVEVNPLTGDIKAVGVGTATLTATLTATGVTTTVTVNVKAPDYNIAAPDEITVYVDKTKNLGVTVTPNYKVPTITYTSADTSIVTVDTNGNIKGVAVGTTTVTATLPNGKSKTVTVNVTLDPNNKISVVFSKTTGIDIYHVSTDGGKTFSLVWGNSTIDVVKGSEIIVKIPDSSNSYTYYVNGNAVNADSNNSIKLTINEYTLIGAATIDIPDAEESLNWFQKIIKAIKEFFQKLFGKE